jgi:hypothetical protein
MLLSALRNSSRIGLFRRLPTGTSTSSSSSASSSLLLRHKSSASGGIPAPILKGWYGIFGKSAIGYATWLVAGIIVAEGLTGAVTDGVWNSVNAGRTYHTVDWSKFKSGDEDDEEEEEEEVE